MWLLGRWRSSGRILRTGSMHRFVVENLPTASSVPTIVYYDGFSCPDTVGLHYGLQFCQLLVPKRSFLLQLTRSALAGCFQFPQCVLKCDRVRLVAAETGCRGDPHQHVIKSIHILHDSHLRRHLRWGGMGALYQLRQLSGKVLLNGIYIAL